VLSDKSRSKRPINTKICRKIAHATGNNEHQFQGQRSKVKVSTSIIAETGSALYLPNGRVYELETRYTEYEDPYRRQAPYPPRSKVKVAMPRGASDRCWPINREQKVPEIQKLVGSLPTPRAIKRTSFKVKRSKIKVTRPTIMLKAEVLHICRIGRPTNFKLGTQLEHEELHHGQRHDLQSHGNDVTWFVRGPCRERLFSKKQNW